MKYSLTLLLFALVSCVTSPKVKPAHATISPELQKIFDKSDAAMGGTQNIKAIKSSYSRSKIIIQSMDISFTQETFLKGNKIYTKTEQQPGIFDEAGYDGKTAWSKTFSFGIRKLKFKEAFGTITSTIKNSLNPEKMYDAILLKGKTTFDKKECYQVIFRKKGLDDSITYIDSKTFMIAGGTTSDVGPQGVSKGTFYIKKYTTSTSGVKYPTEILFETGPSKITIQSDVYNENAEIDDKIFAMPTK